MNTHAQTHTNERWIPRRPARGVAALMLLTGVMATVPSAAARADGPGPTASASYLRVDEGDAGTVQRDAIVALGVIGNLDVDGDRDVTAHVTVDRGTFADTGQPWSDGSVVIADDDAAPAGGRVRGRVLDGLPAGGFTLEGATVNVYPTGEDTPFASATTLADGNYAVDVPPGSYDVQFTMPGLYADQWWSAAGSRSAATTIDVGQDQIVTAIDGNLTPTDAGHLTGRVTEADGQPVTADVHAIVVGNTSMHYVTATATDGTYDLAVPEGNYWIAAIVAGRQPVYQPDVPTLEASATWFVRVGATVGGADLRFPATTATIAGTITRAVSNVALGGACVQLVDASGAAGPNGCADASGAYSIPGVAPGAWTVSFTKSGYAEQWYDGAADASAATAIMLSAGQVLSGVNGRLAPTAGVITGVITMAGTGSAMSGACATAWRWPTLQFPVTACAGTDGRFTIDGLDPGDYVVQFRAAGHVDLWYPNATSYGTGAVPVTVALGGVVDGVDAALVASATISGRVVDDVGRPVGGANVLAVDATAGQFGATTAADGTYSMTVPPGSYLVRTEHSGYETTYHPNAAEQQGAAAVVVGAGASASAIDITAMRSAVLAGTVINVNSRQPVTSSTVHMFRDGVERSAGFTDADGTFAFGVAPGNWTVLFTTASASYYDEWYDDGFSPASATVLTLAPGTTTSIEGHLSTTYLPTLRLGVTDSATGRPLAGPCVEVYAASSNALLSTRCSQQTDDAGFPVFEPVTGNPVWTTGWSGSLPGRGGYKIHVVQPAGESTPYTDAWLGGGSSLATAATLTVEFGQDRSGAVQLSATRLPQAITFAPATSVAVRSSTQLVATGGSSGNPVQFSVDATSDRGVCTISGSTATFAAIGRCVIDANQAGNASYLPAAEVQAVINVRRAQTITFTAISTKTLAQSPVAVTATASSVLVVTFTSSTPTVCTVVSASVTLLAAGSCSILASQAGDSTYAPAAPVTRSFTVNKISQTITFASPGTKTLAQSPVAVTATASSGLPVTLTSTTPTVCTMTSGSINLLVVGSCSIVASQGGNVTYNAAASITRTFTVNKVSQTITFASPGAKTLAQSPVAVTATASSGLPVTLTSTTPTVCTMASGSISLLAAGSCSIVASQAGNDIYNAAASITRTFTVNKNSQTITFAAIANKRLAQSPVVASATSSSGLVVTLSSTTPTVCRVAGTTITLVAAGTCSIVAAQSGDASYAAATSVTRSFKVT